MKDKVVFPRLSACKVSEMESAPVATHSHHWRLSEPQGPVTHGRCLRCGAEREFSPAGPDSLPHTMSLKANRKRRTK